MVVSGYGGYIEDGLLFCCGFCGHCLEDKFAVWVFAETLELRWPELIFVADFSQKLPAIATPSA